jgi:hypothetical protein
MNPNTSGLELTPPEYEREEPIGLLAALFEIERRLGLPQRKAKPDLPVPSASQAVSIPAQQARESTGYDAEAIMNCGSSRGGQTFTSSQFRSLIQQQAFGVLNTGEGK